MRYSRCLVDPVNSRRTDSHGGGGTTGALICVHEILREKKTSVFTKYTLHVKKKRKKKKKKVEICGFRDVTVSSGRETSG